MAYASNYQPDKDAGWGLIFRLNGLWDKVDRVALSGDYDKWELVLDRIFNNLLYRNDMEILKDEEGDTLDVTPSESDIKEWEIMKYKIKKAKSDKIKALRIRSMELKKKSEGDHYHSLFFYEVWLRKFMQAHGLYLKEIENNPSKALFGGAFRGK